MITPKQAVLLKVIRKTPGIHGAAVVRESAGLAKGGSIYGALERLTLFGLTESWLVESPEGEPGGPRRAYRITAEGQKKLAEYETAESRIGK
jgi:DNA-binding PadR family transcriptional regulator